MKNDYEVRGDTTAIFLKSAKHGNVETLIATSDLERAKEFNGTWYPFKGRNCKSLYVAGTHVNEAGKRVTVRLHRWILNVKDPKLSVDHVLHDTLDNCRWALNVVSHAENHQNLRLPSNNTSGHIGVSINKQAQRWQARLSVNGKTKHLGLFENKEDAIEARKLAEDKFFKYKRKIM